MVACLRTALIDMSSSSGISFIGDFLAYCPCSFVSSPSIDVARVILKTTSDQYYISFPDDKPLTKGLVYGTYCLEVVQTILMTRDCFITYATGFGNLNALDSTHLLWLTAPIFIGISTYPTYVVDLLLTDTRIQLAALYKYTTGIGSTFFRDLAFSSE